VKLKKKNFLRHRRIKLNFQKKSVVNLSSMGCASLGHRSSVKHKDDEAEQVSPSTRQPQRVDSRRGHAAHHPEASPADRFRKPTQGGRRCQSPVPLDPKPSPPSRFTEKHSSPPPVERRPMPVVPSNRSRTSSLPSALF
jgi:hypothetical protein